MYKPWFVFTVALLGQEALGYKVKFQFHGEGNLEDGIDWAKLFYDPNREHPSTSNSSTEDTNQSSISEGHVIRDCIQSCPVTSEYNPVCGTDNVTYDNPGRLLCAQECGVNVKKKTDRKCPDSYEQPVA